MSPTLISFVTCIYNQNEDIFRATVASVLPHLDHAEWVLVDDGSDLGRRNKIEDVLDGLPSERIFYERLPRNAGLAVARNRALSRVEGEWVVILDSDDIVPADLNLTLLGLDREASVVAGNAIYFRADGQYEYRDVHRFEELFRGKCHSPLNPFFWYDFYYHGIIARRRVFSRYGGYNPRYRVGEDQEMLIRLVLGEGEEHVRFISTVVYHYRDNPDGVCAKMRDLVYAGYCETMLQLMRDITDVFSECRLHGTVMLDGVWVDQYEYFHHRSGWITLEQASAILQ